MHTLWKEESRRQVLTRARKLTPDSRALWGKFTVDRMLAHVVETFKMALGELPVRPKNLPLRHWPLNLLVIYFAPWPKGLPTARELIARSPESFERELASLERYMATLVGAADRKDWPAHPAFGKLSRRSWGRLGYRHLDHHLRQFGV
jgi:hypothetical protein